MMGPATPPTCGAVHDEMSDRVEATRSCSCAAPSASPTVAHAAGALPDVSGEPGRREIRDRPISLGWTVWSPAYTSAASPRRSGSAPIAASPERFPAHRPVARAESLGPTRSLYPRSTDATRRPFPEPCSASRAGHAGYIDRVSCVGYYVHHHGAGHEQRFRAISAAAPDIGFVPISELPFEAGVLLPSDVPAESPDDPTAGGQLHWAPLDAETATRRLKTIVDWLDACRPTGVVVDVSVEMVLACRLAGVRTIAVRQHGDRADAAHALAFGSAARLLAPFPAEFETSTDPDLVGKTDHVGFIPPSGWASPAGSSPVTSEDVVVLWGRGGGTISGRTIDAIAAATPGRVYCAGIDIWDERDPPTSHRITSLGWVDDPRSLLVNRPVVVGSCGNNCVALVASSECAFVAVPQSRPFDEQVRLAEALEAGGLAVTAPRTDEVAAWREAIDRAEHRSKRWARLEAPVDGAAVAAGVIRRWLT